MNKQAALEHWLASGKPITSLLAFKMWMMTDFRKGITRVRQHTHVEDRWVERDGARHKVYWMPVRKCTNTKASAQR